MIGRHPIYSVIIQMFIGEECLDVEILFPMNMVMLIRNRFL